MPLTWQLRDQDRECFERELNDFVPDRVFDMHAHLWRKTDFEDHVPQFVAVGPDEVTMERYRDVIAWILPHRTVHGLFFPFPSAWPNATEAPNDWVSREIKKDPMSRGQFYVRPDDDPDWVRAEVLRLGLRGFKPFCCFAKRSDRENAEIPEYLPEWIPRLAHEHGWSITLHMQRARSLADPSNQHWINTYCRKYPNMALILDHCARGFNPYQLIEGLRGIEPAQNLFIDTSVACNPLAIWACVEHFGVDHIVYASDFYCSHLRGTNLPCGDSFIWLDESQNVWDFCTRPTPQPGPLLIGLENLRAVKAVFRRLRLSDAQIESYFWSNAARLLGL